MTRERPSGRAAHGGAAPGPNGRAESAGGRDGGYATVWAAITLLGLVVLVVLAVQVFSAMSGRHRAEAAADLGALAAAGHTVDGEAAACAYAARVADRMGARLVNCAVTGWEVRVEVTVIAALRLPGGGVAHGRARAGPVPG